MQPTHHPHGLGTIQRYRRRRSYTRLVSALAFDLDDNDDIGFVHQVRPIVAGVLRVVEPVEVYLVKVDNWFGENWLGFSNKLVGAVGVQYRQTLRVHRSFPLAEL